MQQPNLIVSRLPLLYYGSKGFVMVFLEVALSVVIEIATLWRYFQIL